MMARSVLWMLIAAGWTYWAAVRLTTRRVVRRRQHPSVGPLPPVSILKPVRGLDAGAYENFASFCRQDYPEMELLVGIAKEDDPVVPVIRRLQREFPNVEIRLVRVPPGRAMNPKSSILEELSRQAQHPVLVISDSDIRVTPECLCRVVAPLGDPKVGLVTCPYYSEAELSLAGRLEALYLNADFVPSAIAAWSWFGTPIGLGAMLVLRRDDLENVGGYAAFGDFLSDDYHVARRIAALGKKVVFSDYVVTNVLGATGMAELWRREVRWARSVRVLRPRLWPGLLVTFSTPLAMMLVVVSRGATGSLAALAGSLLVRWITAAGLLRDAGRRPHSRDLLWLPVRDVLTATVWGTAAFGERVVWRNQEFRLLRDGRLQPAETRPPTHERLLRRVVRAGDAVLRRVQGILEYSDHPDCMLRISIACADSEVVLRDGTRIPRGAAIGELHFWNEKVPPIGAAGPDMAWAREFRRKLRRSLRDLAAHVERNPRYEHIAAWRAYMPVSSRNSARAIERLSRYLDVEVHSPEIRNGVRSRLSAWGRNLLLRLLIRTYNPHSLRGGRRKQRCEVWLSRGALLQNRGTAPLSGDGPDQSGEVNRRRDRIDQGESRGVGRSV